MDEDTLRVLRKRKDIACVLVNPLQALHPNANAPTDSMLVDSGRSAGYDRQRYTEWLEELREVCTERGIVLIFDEVFVGFRLAPGGAQEYFGVKADMVTYGKTLGGGLPIGALCGRQELMRRFRDDRPADICFARGTFNSHPYVMAAMQEFLQRIETPEIRGLYRDLDRTWNDRAERLNQRLLEEGLPGAGRQPVDDLDGHLHATVSLQLDAAILSACRGAGVELGGDRPLHLQPELHRGRLRSRGRPLRGRRAQHAARRLLVVEPSADEQVDQAPGAAGDAGSPLIWVTTSPAGAGEVARERRTQAL